MEAIDIEQEQKIEVNATEIIAKYKNIEDKKMFCFKKNWWHPDEKSPVQYFF